jgi:hypothetical protein
MIKQTIYVNADPAVVGMSKIPITIEVPATEVPATEVPATEVPAPEPKFKLSKLRQKMAAAAATEEVKEPPKLTKMLARLKERDRMYTNPQTDGEMAVQGLIDYCKMTGQAIKQEDIDACLTLDTDKQRMWDEMEAAYAEAQKKDELGPKPEFGTPAFWTYMRKQKQLRLAREAEEAKAKAEAIARGESLPEEKPKKKRGPAKKKEAAV